MLGLLPLPSLYQFIDWGRQSGGLFSVWSGRFTWDERNFSAHPQNSPPIPISDEDWEFLIDALNMKSTVFHAANSPVLSQGAQILFGILAGRVIMFQD